MPFPTELPLQAARQVARFLAKKDLDKGRLALALYELTGFGLGKAFPNAAYLADAPLEVTDPKVNELVGTLMSDQPLADLSPELELLLQAAIAKLIKWGLSKLGL